MAQKIVVNLVDDTDGSEASSTLRFGWEGTDYEIDLSEHNAQRLRTYIQPFVAAARKTNKPVKQPPARRRNLKAIREWAAEQGIEVNLKGRIPADIIEKYEANNN